MPVRMAVSLSNGQVRYESDPTVDPIQLHQVDITAGNVTNRPPDNEPYPSELRVNARLKDDAELAFDSRADFLAKPSPRVDGDLKVQHLTLPTLRPLTRGYNVQVRQGKFDMSGHVNSSAPTTIVSVNNFLLEGAKVDYVHTAQTKHKEVKTVGEGGRERQGCS